MNQNEINNYVKDNIKHLSLQEAWDYYIRASYLNHPKKIKESSIPEFDAAVLSEISEKINDENNSIYRSSSPLLNDKSTKTTLSKEISSLVTQRNRSIQEFHKLNGSFIGDIFGMFFKYTIYAAIAVGILSYMNIIDYKVYVNKIANKEIFKIASKVSGASTSTEVSQSNSITPIVKKYTLAVTTTPKDARVQIVNIDAKYYNNIALKPNKYIVKISKRGYISQTFPVVIKNNDITLHKTLQKQTIALHKSSKVSNTAVKYKVAKKLCAHYNMILPTTSSIENIFHDKKEALVAKAYYWTQSKDAVKRFKKHLVVRFPTHTPKINSDSKKAYVVCIEK